MGSEVKLDLSFEVARARLMSLARDGWLSSASEDACAAGVTGLARVGALGLSREVRVQARELTERDGLAGLAIRWEVAGPGGGLFPVLDADITVHLAVNEQGTLLTLAGAYRPPLGALGEVLDRAILHRVAAAAVRNFLSRVAAALAGQPGLAAANAGLIRLPWAPWKPLRAQLSVTTSSRRDEVASAEEDATGNGSGYPEAGQHRGAGPVGARGRGRHHVKEHGGIEEPVARVDDGPEVARRQYPPTAPASTPASHCPSGSSPQCPARPPAAAPQPHGRGPPRPRARVSGRPVGAVPA